MKILIAVILFGCLLLLRIKMPLPVIRRCNNKTGACGELDTNWIIIFAGAMLIAAILMRIKKSPNQP